MMLMLRVALLIRNIKLATLLVYVRISVAVMADQKGSHAFAGLKQDLQVGEDTYQYFNLTALNDQRYDRLPYSIRVLLESAIRNCDGFFVKEADAEKILNWEQNQNNSVEVPFKPARVIMQDFTGVPAVVDFAAMRDAVKRLGGNPDKINPVCPADLVIDHSVQVDVTRSFRPRITRNAPNPGGGNTGRSSCGGVADSCIACIGQGYRLPILDEICPYHHLPSDW